MSRHPFEASGACRHRCRPGSARRDPPRRNVRCPSLSRSGLPDDGGHRGRNAWHRSWTEAVHPSRVAAEEEFAGCRLRAAKDPRSLMPLHATAADPISAMPSERPRRRSRPNRHRLFSTLRRGGEAQDLGAGDAELPGDRRRADIGGKRRAHDLLLSRGERWGPGAFPRPPARRGPGCLLRRTRGAARPVFQRRLSASAFAAQQRLELVVLEMAQRAREVARQSEARPVSDALRGIAGAPPPAGPRHVLMCPGRWPMTTLRVSSSQAK